MMMGNAKRHSAREMLASAYGTRYNLHRRLEDDRLYAVAHDDPEDRIYFAPDEQNFYRAVYAGGPVWHCIGLPAICWCAECSRARRLIEIEAMPTVEWSRIRGLDGEEIESAPAVVAPENAAPEGEAAPKPSKPKKEKVEAPEVVRVKQGESCAACNNSGFIKTGKPGRPPRCKACNWASGVAGL